MSSVPAPVPAARSFEVTPLLVAFGGLLAVAVGLAVGFPTGETRLLALALIGSIAVVAAVLQPLPALLILYASSIILIVWVVDHRSISTIDLLEIPLFIAGFFGVARRRAELEDAARTGPEHAALRQATRLLTRSVTIFYAIAALSLVALGLRGHWDQAGDSGQLLFRAAQGLVLFAMGTWWLRTESDFRAAVNAVQIGLLVLLVLNVWFLVTAHIPRAAMTWSINNADWPMSCPNEAAVALLVVMALVFSKPRGWRNGTEGVLLVAALVLLIFTRSRSGLLAWVVFGVASIRGRWKPVLRTATVAALTLPLVPSTYWGRIARTLTPSEASFETFGTIIRLYTWDTARRVFLDHPFGVGYLGFRFVSVGYNEMKLVLYTCENYFIESATGLGIPGVAALGVALWTLLQLDRPVLAAAPPGTFAHEMARRHRPLILGLCAANLTGDNFMGMVGLAQLALWCVLLIRAGHVAIEARSRA